MHVAKLHIQGNSLVGLYILPLNNIVLVGPEVPESMYEIVEDVFKAKIVVNTIAGTSLIGAFLATDGTRLLVPEIIFPHEEDILKKENIPYAIIPSTLTCLGNNIAFTKNGILLNSEYEPEAKEAIKNFVGSIPVKTINLTEYTTIGSLLACNSTKGLVSPDLDDATIAEITSVLGVELTPGTVNLGGAQVHSGIAVNDNGFIIGELSGGPEIVNADEAFGFMNK